MTCLLAASPRGMSPGPLADAKVDPMPETGPIGIYLKRFEKNLTNGFSRNAHNAHMLPGVST